ncbi:MAG: hypothetical protein K8R77_16605 [Anaerolineaceae bacterium]|nr:hypothetical protein [Anaerolineaceae bacterium]
MSKFKILIIAALVLLLSTACLSFGGLGEKVMDKALDKALEEADLPEGALETAQAGFEAISTEVLSSAEEAMDDVVTDAGDSPYPVPDDAQNLMNLDGVINYQTSLTLDEVVAFYRQALAAQGYTERTINTVIEAGVASLVFDGDPSGKALVVQVVSLGESSNVNVRLEDT